MADASVKEDEITLLPNTHPKASRFRGDRSVTMPNFSTYIESRNKFGPSISERILPSVQLGPLPLDPKSDDGSDSSQPAAVSISVDNAAAEESPPYMNESEQRGRSDDTYAGYGRSESPGGSTEYCGTLFCRVWEHLKRRVIHPYADIFCVLMQQLIHGTMQYCGTLFCRVWEYLKRRVIHPDANMVLLWNRIYAVSCWVGFFIDPLFYLAPTVQKSNKCIAKGWSIAIALVIVRSVTDFIYLMHMILQCNWGFRAPNTRVFDAEALISVCRCLRGYFINFILVLPVPQMMLLLILPKSTGSPGDNLFYLYMAILGQYIVRGRRFFRFLNNQYASVHFTDWAFSRIGQTVALFVLNNHMFGCLWYLFGLVRVSGCLKDACRDSGFSFCSQLLHCEYWKKSGSRLNAWKNNTKADSCFTQEGYSYGISDGAVDLSTEDSFFTRFLYSLFWGLQQVSTMAGNLKPSHSVGEIMFTMGITLFGIFYLALLIGNLQNIVQGRGQRITEMLTRRSVVAQWMSARQFPLDIQREVLEAENLRWLATRGEKEEAFLEDLPDDLQIRIRRHMFKKFFEKMKLHNSPIVKDDTVLNSFCERFKQKTYIKGCKILDLNGIVDKMVFIVQGSMESVGEDGSIMYLYEGDVCGEELITWCLEKFAVNQGAMTSRRSKTSVKCVTNVEAFTLSDEDIEETIRRFISSFQDPQL